MLEGDALASRREQEKIVRRARNLSEIDRILQRNAKEKHSICKIRDIGQQWGCHQT